MFEYSAYMNLKNGKTAADRVFVKEEILSDGVVAVYVDAKAPASIGDGDVVSLDREFGVGIDIGVQNEIKSCMADYRCSEFWCKPAFCDDMSSVPDETQLLVIALKDGRFAVAVPVVNDKYKIVFKGKDKNTFTARIFSWCDGLYTCNGLTFVYAVGENVSSLSAKCVKAALKILNNGVRHREERRYPEIFDYLGWCSWDSMQIRVCEDGLVEKCDEFKEKNIPVKWAVIDDMWAEIRDFYNQEYTDFMDMVHLMHRSAMWHFEADPYRFPNGLAHAIGKIKEYGIKVGMWHPTTGYWRGIDPDGEAYRYLKDYLIESPQKYLVPHWKKDKSYLYYKTFHDFFRACGADFVKIDNQSMTNRYYKGMAPVGQVAKEFHAGMEASVGEHFDNCMINCMGMSSEDIWSRSVSSVSRCSDDFQPENKEWFSRHILMCAYNSILQGEFYWCDWDMWWTDDGQAKKNSLMRAISGGPVYVSDKIGRSHRDILAPLATDDGKILRCDKPCVPTNDCMTQDPTKSKKALKLQNTVGKYGIMAVLNIDEKSAPVTATISERDIDGFEADEYVVYEHFSKEAVFMKKGESFDIELKDDDDYRLYIFAPVKDGFAAIGRTDKFISPKTIEYVCDRKIKLTEDGPYAYAQDGKIYFA